MRMTINVRCCGWGLPAVVLCSLLVPAAMVLAQDVRPASSGAVQSVKSGINQGVRGTIARGPGGEHAGTAGYTTSERGGRVISGKVAGYGARQSAGGLAEYAGKGHSSFGGNGDFPDTDFVASMPKPHFGGVSAAPSGLGITRSVGPVPSGARAVKSSHGAHAPVHTQMKDPEAILHPFTHSIGGNLGQMGSAPTVLGAAPH